MKSVVVFRSDITWLLHFSFTTLSRSEFWESSWLRPARDRNPRGHRLVKFLQGKVLRSFRSGISLIQLLIRIALMRKTETPTSRLTGSSWLWWSTVSRCSSSPCSSSPPRRSYSYPHHGCSSTRQSTNLGSDRGQLAYNQLSWTGTVCRTPASEVITQRRPFMKVPQLIWSTERSLAQRSSS